MQKILYASSDYAELDAYFKANKIKRLLLVCDPSFSCLRLAEYFAALPTRLRVEVFRFADFQSNPQYESVRQGVVQFQKNRCEAIAAVGGGSAMDIAKCIKLFAFMPTDRSYLQQEIIPNAIPLLAVPTTAGTGSEATRYAVIYANGQKQSITDDSCIPETVLLDASTLYSLPAYQRKSTMLDALCHGIESYWSIHSTLESEQYSRQAIEMVLANIDGYLSNHPAGNAGMMEAAHLAGKAINITQTTAGHAMCYKLTSLYGLAHGHAAALCVARLWPYMLDHVSECLDLRGIDHLQQAFQKIACAMGCSEPKEVTVKLRQLLTRLEIGTPPGRETDLPLLLESVNETRLKNHPVRLNAEAIQLLYRQIIGLDA